MDLKTLSVILAAGRVGYGAGLVLAPRAFARVWVGSRSRDPRTQVVIRAMGIRDLALGAGTLQALTGSGDAQPWLAAQGASDLVDLLATASAGGALPLTTRVGVGAVAAGSAIAAFATAAAGPGGRQ